MTTWTSVSIASVRPPKSFDCASIINWALPSCSAGACFLPTSNFLVCGGSCLRQNIQRSDAWRKSKTVCRAASCSITPVRRRMPCGLETWTWMGVRTPMAVTGGSSFNVVPFDRTSSALGTAITSKITTISSFFTFSASLFRVGIDPVKEGLVPEQAVLRLEDPVAFVGENDQARRNLLHLQRGEQLQALAVGHAKI